jgi:hypothetical protein
VSKVVKKSCSEGISTGELLDIETFYFTYPSLSMLVHLMSKTHSAEYILDDQEYKLVRSSGIEDLDDFTLVSKAKLHSWTSIPMEKIHTLYRGAEAMIEDFHIGKKEEIEEIWESRAAGCAEDEVQ